MKYNIISLKNICNMVGKDVVEEVLGDFKCDLNEEIENFLKNKAIEFSIKSIAETFIVTARYKEKDLIVGYFTLTYKIVKVPKSLFKGKTKKRILRFAQFNEDEKYYLIPLPLIGQIGKNYFNYNNELISGDKLLKLALNKIKEVQNIIGGRFTFIECSDNIKLKEFYERNGFRQFSERISGKNENKSFSEEHLVQMICDLSNY